MVYDFLPRKEFISIIEKLPLCCVDLIVVKNKKVLLIKRTNDPVKGFFWIPGGRINKNEKIEDAVFRKSKEELGVDVKIIKKLGTFEYFFDDFPELKTGSHAINITFIIEPLSESIKIDDQGEEFKWIEKIENDLHPYLKKILNESKVFEDAS